MHVPMKPIESTMPTIKSPRAKRSNAKGSRASMRILHNTYTMICSFDLDFMHLSMRLVYILFLEGVEKFFRAYSMRYLINI